MNYELNAPDSMLKGICDIHIHATPDSRMRSVDEWHFAQEAPKTGYQAIMYKSNDFTCHDRAFLVCPALIIIPAECFPIDMPASLEHHISLGLTLWS